MPGRYAFTKEERLLRPSEFARVRKSGRRYSSLSFAVYALQNGLGFARLGVSVSARVGGAVTRNRIKRLIRESFRLNREVFPGSSDLLVTVKGASAITGLDGVTAELKEAFVKGSRGKEGRGSA